MRRLQALQMALTGPRPSRAQGRASPPRTDAGTVPHRSRPSRGPMGRPRHGVNLSPRPRRAGERFDFCQPIAYPEKQIIICSNDMTETEQKEWDLKLRKLDTGFAKLAAVTFELNAEGAKLRTEDRWYLLIIGSGATLAIVAVAKLFL